MHAKGKEYIQKLRLKKHPEGGYYQEVYRSAERILPAHLPKRYKTSRNFSTSIYFLLDGKQFSAFHLLQSDELWHFYDGCNLLIYIIDQKGNLTQRKVGRGNGCSFQITIEKKNWFAAELENKKSFALVGCTVAPAFEFDDFILGYRKTLMKKYPKHKILITRLTRS